MADNFGEAFISGVQGGQQQQINAQNLQLGAQDLQKGELDIQRTQMMLRQQEAKMHELARLNGRASSPGSTPTTPQDLARHQAQQLSDAADISFRLGMFEDAKHEAETAGKLAENAAKIDADEATVSIKKAEFTSNVMQHALEARDNPQEFQRRTRSALMAFQETFSEQSPLANKPMTPELAEALVKAAVSRREESQARLDKAHADQAEATAAAERALVPLRAAQTTAATARTEAIKKSGGVTAGQKATADMQADVINDLDHMMDQLQTMESDPTGLKGRYHHFAEFVGSISPVGIPGGKGTEVTRFHQDIDALQVKLGRALTGTSYRSKEVQKLIADLADLKATGTSRETAMTKLEELKSLVQSQLTKAGVKPSSEEQTMTLEQFLATQGGGGD